MFSRGQSATARRHEEEDEPLSDRIPDAGLEAQGIETRATLHWNLVTARLVEGAAAKQRMDH